MSRWRRNRRPAFTIRLVVSLLSAGQALKAASEDRARPFVGNEGAGVRRGSRKSASAADSAGAASKTRAIAPATLIKYVSISQLTFSHFAGEFVHRATRPRRGSVSCGWSVPCVSIQLTFSHIHYYATIATKLKGTSGNSPDGTALCTQTFVVIRLPRVHLTCPRPCSSCTPRGASPASRSLAAAPPRRLGTRTALAQP